jgi:hypothetical protein
MEAAQLQAEAAKLRKQAEALENEAIGLLSPAQCRQAAKNITGRKGNVAVFLGAGASKTFGWPLTNELLPIIIDGIIKEDLFNDRRINSEEDDAADRELLTETLTSLCPGLKFTRKFLKQSKQRLPLVTSLLSMLDYSVNSGQALVSGLSADQIRDARVLLERAIYETIEHEEIASGPNYWPPREPNALTQQLVRWLDKIRPSSTSIGVITSNYDLAIEKAWGFKRDDLHEVDDLSQSLDFGFDWLWPSHYYPERIIARPASPKRRLYKLHGSTNWLHCGLCDRMYINPKIDIAVYAYERESEPNNGCHCGHYKLEVQIVSPSFVREMRAPNLISVWQRALNWLRKADDWIIIGYSFPDEDLNIRSLFTRALASRRARPHVTAIQLGSNEQTRMRYEAFFPSDHLTFLNGGLEVFLNNVNRA